MSWVIWAHAMKRRLDLLEAIERLQAGPGDLVDHKQLAEALQLDLQTVEDELETMKQAQLIELKPAYGDLYVELSTAGRRLLREQAEKRMRLPSAREAQQYILQLLIDQPPRADARWTTDADVARALDLDEQFIRDNLEELKAQNLVKLQQPVDMGGVIIADLTAPGRIKAREPGYVSSNATQAAYVTFDQRGQHVTYQYNAAGDINIGAVQNKVELIDQLEKLKAEISKAEEAQAIDADTATEARFEIERAVNQAKKDQPNNKTLVERIQGGAKVLQAAATGAAAVPALIDALHNLAARIPHLPF